MKFPNLHPESFLHLALVRDLVNDRSVRLVSRPLDAGWQLQGFTKTAVGGFQPFLGQLFHATRSPLASWLLTPDASPRAFNAFDGLCKDLFMLVHDYLHILACRAIHQAMPELGFGTRPASPDQRDVHVFCHLLTEAFATIGLDYWYLCTFDLNTRLDIGTRFRSLTVTFHEAQMPEYRRFYPDLQVQDPKFFQDLTHFYASGELWGFEAQDLLASPMLGSWLRQELRYAEKQRSLAREWFSYMGGIPCDPDSSALTEPLAVTEDWQLALMETLGNLLWDYIKHEKKPDLPSLPVLDWFAQVDPSQGILDFRFLNLAVLDPDALLYALREGTHRLRGFSSFYQQSLAQVSFADFPAELRRLLPMLEASGDFAMVYRFFKTFSQVPGGGHEPLHLLFVN